MSSEGRSRFKDGKNRDDDDLVVVWCFAEGKIRTANKRCEGNSGRNEKVQTEVAWTCGEQP